MTLASDGSSLKSPRISTGVSNLACTAVRSPAALRRGYSGELQRTWSPARKAMFSATVMRAGWLCSLPCRRDGQQLRPVAVVQLVEHRSEVGSFGGVDLVGPAVGLGEFEVLRDRVVVGVEEVFQVPPGHRDRAHHTTPDQALLTEGEFYAATTCSSRADGAKPTRRGGWSRLRRCIGSGAGSRGDVRASGEALVQWRLTTSQCQRSNRSGVTNRWRRRCLGGSRASAARTARSGRAGCDRATCRRRTCGRSRCSAVGATSWLPAAEGVLADLAEEVVTSGLLVRDRRVVGH